MLASKKNRKQEFSYLRLFIFEINYALPPKLT
jgi:hypothetical protein